MKGASELKELYIIGGDDFFEVYDDLESALECKEPEDEIYRIEEVSLGTIDITCVFKGDSK